MSKCLTPLERALRKRFKNSIAGALRFFGLHSGGVWWTWHDMARVVSADPNLQTMLGRGFKFYFDGKAAA